MSATIARSAAPHRRLPSSAIRVIEAVDIRLPI
jgi:hypothetical protein